MRNILSTLFIIISISVCASCIGNENGSTDVSNTSESKASTDSTRGAPEANSTQIDTLHVDSPHSAKK